MDDNVLLADQVGARSQVTSARELLKLALENKLGEVVEPRPGQQMLCDDVDATMSALDTDEDAIPALIGRAKTGTGKSLGYLAPAIFAAAEHGERTVISTKGLGLQRQIVDKDAPHINAALTANGYSPVPIAVLKGFSNYVCPRSLLLSASSIAEDIGGAKADEISARVSNLTSKDADVLRSTEANHDFVAAAMKRTVNDMSEVLKKSGDKVDTDHGTLNSGELLDFFTWAAGEGMTSNDQGQIADVSDYGGRLTGAVKGLATQQKSDCPKDCPLASICPPNKSRDRAHEASVIVTNHTFLAIQATEDVPVVISNSNVGEIDHLIIDEAHDLPSITRNQAQGTISSRSVHKLAIAIARVLTDQEMSEKLVAKASGLQASIDAALEEIIGTKRGDVTIADDVDPTRAFHDQAYAWIVNARADLRREESTIPHTSPSSDDIRRRDRINGLRRRLGELSSTLIDCGEHRVGRARWATRDSEYNQVSLSTSAVDVSRILTQRVFTRYLEPEGPDEADTDPDAITEEDEGGEGEPYAPPRWRSGQAVPLSVTCVSATLSPMFSADIGLDVDVIDYPSVFDANFARSALYSPRVGTGEGALPPEVVAFNNSRGSVQKWKLDYSRHRDWCAKAIGDLVEANGGSALILATSAQNGRTYADALRRRFRRKSDPTILDQWSGAGTSALTQQFTDDHASVLVATRGWMTGVDVPGDSLSLVVIDRIPRSPANAVDDARSDLLSASGVSGFVEQDIVYGSDAAEMLEQACGRLIRSASDDGMVALLDPRVSPKSSLTNKRLTSYGYYKKAIGEFGHKLSSHDDALAWLKRARNARERS